MKILEFTRSYYPSIGGMEKFVSDRVKIYQALGYQYKIFATTHSEIQLENSQKDINVEYLKSLTPLKIIPKLSQCNFNDFDVISVNQVGYHYSYAVVKLAHELQKKIVVTPHFYFHTNRYKLFKKIFTKYFVRSIFQMADKIICFTEYEKKFWLNKFNFITDKITTIPHYCSIENISNNVLLKNTNDFLFYLGRGDHNKKIDLLIEAFDKCNTELSLWMTLNENEISKKSLKIVQLNRRIKLLGRVTEENKMKLLNDCAALILPTEFEAFGIVNFEASKYAKPLLVSNLNLFNEILDSRGVIYFQNSIIDLIAKIEYFSKLTEHEKQFMGKINYENLKKFSFSNIIKKYELLYSNLK